METGVTLHGDVARVRIAGRIVDGEPAEDLKRTLHRLHEEGGPHTIVDLTDVTWFDSLALGILVAHYVSVSRRGGRVLVLGANEKIRKLMGMARVADRFGWASDLDEALRWFR